MSVAQTLEALLQKGEKALVPFVTAGDPGLKHLPDILHTLVEGGADVIEVGIPYSDPIADGPTIQASSQRALERGVTLAQILETLQNTPVPVPVVLMGYYNTVLRKGLGAFAQSAKQSGAYATIMCDLIPEEAEDWIATSQNAGLENVFLAAPTSTDARLDAVCNLATGFVYAVSRTGVTGTESKGQDQAQELVKRLKARTQKPVCVGFGISQPEHIRTVCQYADGAVVGSALVSLLEKEWNEGKGRSLVLEKIKALKQATR